MSERWRPYARHILEDSIIVSAIAWTRGAGLWPAWRAGRPPPGTLAETMIDAHRAA